MNPILILLYLFPATPTSIGRLPAPDSPLAPKECLTPSEGAITMRTDVDILEIPHTVAYTHVLTSFQ